jgi:hypothetical protein
MDADEKGGKGKKSNKLLAALPKLKLKKKALKSTLEALSPIVRQLIGHVSVHGTATMPQSLSAPVFILNSASLGIHVEGIFRLSGSLTTMQQLQKSVFKGACVCVRVCVVLSSRLASVRNGDFSPSLASPSHAAVSLCVLFR